MSVNNICPLCSSCDNWDLLNSDSVFRLIMNDHYSRLTGGRNRITRMTEKWLCKPTQRRNAHVIRLEIDLKIFYIIEGTSNELLTRRIVIWILRGLHGSSLYDFNMSLELVKCFHYRQMAGLLLNLMSVWCEVVCSEEPTEIGHPTLFSFSIFQLLVLISWNTTLLFSFNSHSCHHNSPVYSTQENLAIQQLLNLSGGFE